MSKKTLRIITIIATIVVMIGIFSISYAKGETKDFTDPKDLEGKATGDFDNVGNAIIGALKAIGTIISVAILVVLGIKYMMGSAEEKAEYKKTMIPYLIGAVLIFAAPYIASAIYSFSKTNFAPKK